jgi:hypothetical protein
VIDISDLEQVRYVRVDPVPRGTLDHTTGSPALRATPPGDVQLWDFVAPTGDWVFARAEVFPGPTQWGVRVQDRAPKLSDSDLVHCVRRLLVWHVQCPADTVELVLGRSHDRIALVRVGGDYV